jgi:hypothetical protein
VQTYRQAQLPTRHLICPPPTPLLASPTKSGFEALLLAATNYFEQTCCFNCSLLLIVSIY